MSGYTILSLGGSMVIPKEGFDVLFLKEFKILIEEQVQAGKRFVIIVGGGGTCRAYQQALRDVSGSVDEVVDELGIHTTVFNAHFVRLLFGDLAAGELQGDPAIKMDTDKPLIIGSGFTLGNSTDKIAVVASKTYGAKEVINISNVSHVYDKDPREHDDAVKYEKLSWDEYREIVGEKWSPGKSTPFGPPAAKLAQEFGVTVKIVNGKELSEVKNAIENVDFEGSVLT